MKFLRIFPEMCASDLVLVLQLDPEQGVRQRFDDRRHDLDGFVLRHAYALTAAGRIADRLPVPRMTAPSRLDGDRVLEVRRQATGRACAPSSRPPAPTPRRRPSVHHRLDREHHARRQPRPAPRRPVVRHLRLLVQRRARCRGRRTRARRRSRGRPRRAWTAWPMSETRPPGRHRRDALARAPRAVTRSSVAVSAGDRADAQRARRVAEVAVDDGAAVDADDVALLERALAGDPVDDLVVDRGAEGRRVAAVAHERRPRARRRIRPRRAGRAPRSSRPARRPSRPASSVSSTIARRVLELAGAPRWLRIVITPAPPGPPRRTSAPRRCASRRRATAPDAVDVGEQRRARGRTPTSGSVFSR